MYILLLQVILFIFYLIKLLIIAKLVMEQIYYRYLGIGTYDYILEHRQIKEINTKFKNDQITKE